MGWLDVVSNVISSPLDWIGQNQQRQFEKGQANKQWDLAQQNMKMQEDFAKQGIRWRVDDAVAAGLHPLAAMGTMPSSYSPVGMNISGDAGNESRPWSNLGQNLSRAAMSMTTQHEKRMNMLQEMNLKKQNDFIDEQINASKFQRLKNTGPGMPSLTQVMYDRDGNARVVPSQELGQMMQGNTPLTWEYYLNHITDSGKDLGLNLWQGTKSAMNGLWSNGYIGPMKVGD